MISYAICPECQTRIDLNDEALVLLEERRGREYELECINGHTPLLHDAIVATKWQPNHYNVFWNIEGIESGRKSMKVGEWCVIPLGKTFDEIDAIKTICISVEEDHPLLNTRSEALFDNMHPDHFWLMTSGDDDECGCDVRIDWTVYGILPTLSLEVWRENLIFAARQLLSGNYRPCVLQSAVAVEGFVYDVVHRFLREEAAWQTSTIKRYIDGASRDSLPLRGIIYVCVREIMGITISDDSLGRWKRLREMRNALAHGDLTGYMRLVDFNGRRFANERERAEFAYRTAVQFIYDIRYPAEKED